MNARLSTAAAARAAGVQPGTWRAYVQRGQAPQPDGREEISGAPWWWQTTIDVWVATRPGRGARTDLRPGDTLPDLPPGPPALCDDRAGWRVALALATWADDPDRDPGVGRGLADALRIIYQGGPADLIDAVEYARGIVSRWTAWSATRPRT